MFRSSLLALFFCFFCASAVSAAEPIKQPDLVSFGINYMNFDKSQGNRKAADFRGEYRWGLSMLPLISPYFNRWDPYVQFHPYAGLEVTTLQQVYGSGGWAMDVYATKHLVFTWSEGVGLYWPGTAVRLGSFIEFRSMAELGWRFDNDVRLTAEVSHISNAKITRFNPGAEIAGVYLHIPVDVMMGSH
ncbi:MAG: acyloxyacyl hydrolase [Pseudomonadota bacterium]|nr:acyloxyacyl hydrolase [Pseudomonadota bacterium]